MHPTHGDFEEPREVGQRGVLEVSRLLLEIQGLAAVPIRSVLGVEEFGAVGEVIVVGRIVPHHQAVQRDRVVDVGVRRAA